MKHLFVPYELALKLKELGFDEECFGYYRPMKDWMMKGTRLNPETHFHGCNWSNEDNTFYFMYVANPFGDRDSTVKNSAFTKAISNVAIPLWEQAFNWLMPIANKGLGFDDIILEWYHYNLIDRAYSRDIKNRELAHGQEDCLEKLIEIVENKNK